MKNTFYTLLLTGVSILPLTAHAQNLVNKTTMVQTQANQNLTQPELNAIKSGQLTNAGQQIPVETQIMMSTGNLDGYTVGRIQQSLADRGYYKGALTSKWDDNTAAATRAFQQASGDTIDPSGALINSGTLARLGVTMDKLTAGDGARVSDSYTKTSQAETSTNSSARLIASSNTSFSPYNSPTVKSLGSVQMAANDDIPVGTHVSNAKIPAPGQTVPAPDNGPKSTITRDAVATGKFNKTIDGSVAHGTTDAIGTNGTTVQDNTSAGIAATRDTPANTSPVVGNSNLRAGSTSSATLTTTGSLQGSATPGSSGLSGNGTATNNVTGSTGAGSPATTSSAVGGRAVGSLSNSGGTSTTTGGGIAGSGSALSDGASTTSSGSSLSGSSSSGAAGSGSLSSGGGGSGGGGGGGL